MKKHIYLIITALVACYTIYWGNNCIDVTRHVITTDKLPATSSPIKIVHLSDLHNKWFGENQKQLCDIIEQEHPDIIVITGDIIDSRKTAYEPAISLLEQSVAIAPTYFVTGNHDVAIRDYRHFLDLVEDTGTIYLDNSSRTISYGDAFIHLHGVDDSNLIGYKAFYENLETLSTAMDTEQLNILLVHKPRFLETYATLNYDLVFSGHAHGGQIKLPGVGGVFSPGQGFLPKFAAGMIEQDDTKLIVSRGLGNSLFPFRILNNPEVVILTIQPNTL
ncbi:MAG: metallophosphoesterase [Clostridia bacterium]|nr:metallophosphoesterase [Clostridia bacterium]